MIFNTVIQTILTLLGITYTSSLIIYKLWFSDGLSFRNGSTTFVFLSPTQFLLGAVWDWSPGARSFWTNIGPTATLASRPRHPLLGWI